MRSRVSVGALVVLVAIAAGALAVQGLRLFPTVLAVAVVTWSVGRGSSRRRAANPKEPGCRVPPDENALLDDYAADSALALVPDGARRTRPVERQHGCLQLNMADVSQTSATTNFALAGDYDQDALRAAYEPVAAGHGWTRASSVW